jgi:hypothetical protein
VAGEEISYKMSGMKGPGWDWKLGDGGCATAADVAAFNHYWQLALDPSASFGSKGKQVSTSLPLPASNTDFGETNGTILVTADGVHDCSNKAKVFFHKDEMTNPNGTVPNWFYYWKEAFGTVSSTGLPFFTIDPLTGFATPGSAPNTVTFTIDFSNSGNYKWRVPVPGGPPINIVHGSTSSGLDWFNIAQMASVAGSSTICPPLGFRKVMTGCGSIDFTIIIGEGCGYEMKSYDYNLASGALLAPTKYEGIEAYLAVLYHEIEHWKIMERLWPGGYDTQDDCDKDGYPDSWEATDPKAVTYGFIAGVKDVYQSGYDPRNLPAYGAATHYQEAHCRRCEKTKDTALLNASDWSYDKTGNFQGKNW